MTEYEKIEYAKSFIDKLANGINPLDDTPLPENDVANHVRLARCFFYVSGILQKEMEREYKKERNKNKMENVPFSLTPEEVAAFEYSAAPISATAFAQKINGLNREERIAKNMRTFSYRQIFCWLLDVEMLEWREWGNKYKRFPTEAGEKIGLVVQIWENYGRKSPVVYFSEEAQRFVMDHIDAVAATPVKKRKTSYLFGVEEDEEQEEE